MPETNQNLLSVAQVDADLFMATVPQPYRNGGCIIQYL